MARAGVTYHDIAKAAETIKARQQEPTVDRVREHLGTGSKSTIAPHLKRWRAHNINGADAEGLPQDLVSVVKDLHARTQQMADHRVEQIRLEFKASNDKLLTELSESRSSIDELTANQQELENQIKQVTAEKEAYRKSHDDTRANLARVDVQREEVTTRMGELKLEVAELRQENRDIRDHFEHYQQQTAEDRQHERDQFRAANRQLQDQLQDLKSRLNHTEEKLSSLRNNNAQLKGSMTELTQIKTTLTSEIKEKAGDIHNLKRDLYLSQTKGREYQDQTKRLTGQLSKLMAEKSDIEKKLALTSQLFENARADLQAASGKIVLLTDQNRILLQEKSVIQGQFKQLQDSL